MCRVQSNDTKPFVFDIYTVTDIDYKVYVHHGNYSETVGCGLKVVVVIDAYYVYEAKRENRILLTETNSCGLNFINIVTDVQIA